MNNMATKQIRNQVKYLRQFLRYHNYRYHALDKPIITDYYYDMAFKELKDLEQAYPELFDPESPTQKVGWYQMSEPKEPKPPKDW